MVTQTFKNFTLRSEENRSYQKTYSCTFIKAYTSPKTQPNRLLVYLDESIPAEIYNTPTELDALIISPHLEGFEVYPEIKPLPCHVYMEIQKEGGSWELGPYTIIDWGVIEKILE